MFDNPQDVQMIRGALIMLGVLILIATTGGIFIAVTKDFWGGIKSLPKTLIDSVKEFFRLAGIAIPAFVGIAILFFFYRAVLAGHLPKEVLTGHIVLVQMLAISATFGKKAYKGFYWLVILLAYVVTYYVAMFAYGQEWLVSSLIAMSLAGLAGVLISFIRYHRVGMHILSSTLLGLLFHIPLVFVLQQLGVGF